MYAHVVTLPMPISAAITLLKSVLASEQLNIVSDLDMQAQIQDRFGRWVPPQRLLGINSPAFARALRQAEPDLWVRACGCDVREDMPGSTRIAVQEPLALTLVTRNSAACQVLQQASDALQRALTKLRAAPPPP